MFSIGTHLGAIKYSSPICFQLQGVNITNPIMISEMKDNFRGLTKSPLAPPDIEVKAPDPEYIFDVSFTHH